MTQRLRYVWPILLVAAALRTPGMFHDAWFDEAWSFLLVREFVSSPPDILTRLHIDNNHPLTSLWLHVMGDVSPWSVSRLPALVSSLGTVLLAGVILARRGRAHAVAAMGLVAASYPLVLYASEARGYAPMVCFALLAIASYQRYLETRAWPSLAVYWVAVILGFLSHLTFVHAYGALLAWAVWDARRRAVDLHDAVASVTVSQAVPLVFLAVLHRVYVRHLHVAGGEPASMASVLAETVGVTVGVTAGGAGVALASVLLGAVLVAGLVAIWRERRGLFVLLLSAILVVPALTVMIGFGRAAMTPRFFPRYFLVSITLSLLVAAWLVGEQWQKGGARRLAAVLLVVAWIAGQLWHVAAFARGGRGQYVAAVHHMAQASGDQPIRVASNSDLRTGVLLAFHRRSLPSDRRLVFLPRSSAGASQADWYIREDVVATSAVPRELDDSRGRRFRLTARYAFHGLSGCQWSLYERVDTPDTPGTTSERRRSPRP